MKVLGPQYWVGMVFGLGLGGFVVGVLVESGFVSTGPGGGLSIVRSSAALVAVVASVIGTTWLRRGRAEPVAAADTGRMSASGGS